MTVEYVLLLICIFAFVLKVFISGPQEAFKESGPRLAARIEKHIETGEGFKRDGRNEPSWNPPPKSTQ